MAKKSKTQRAKASAARQQRKAAREQEELAANEAAAVEAEDTAKSKKSSSEKKSTATISTSQDTEVKKKTEEKKPKKSHFQFFKDVRSELRRVTWPTRTDVLRWSVVVVVALIFFGVFVAVLDNLVITPLLYLVSGIGV